MQKVPLWTSHYSGRSILTLDKESSEVGPRSILDLCKKNNIKDVYLVESVMTGFLEAYTNCKELNLNLRFGLKLIITDDASGKEDSLKNESKIILFIKNSKGYKDLIKVWAWAYENGFYYVPRIDWKNFNKLITNNLIVAFPFYDSFVAKNTLTFSEIIPSLNARQHTFFVEENGLPFDGIIKEDRLGLDTIYIQAKRWLQTVGRPEIQKFAGALQGFRAKKGIFITTSDFSREAIEYASRIESRIVLIDGEMLWNLMIDFGIGVSKTAAYEIKKIDNDYFDEENA
jgi:hypothetical protein